MSGLVVDTSALAAILFQEPPAPWLRDALEATPSAVISAPSLVQLNLVLEGRSPTDVGVGGRAVRDAGIEVVAFTAEHAERAVEAWRRFGKGRHPASLNFGDCCTFALAEERGLPILCTGDDFLRTGWPVVGC